MALTTKKRLDKHDRDVAAIRALLQEGKRIGAETRKEIRATALIQKRNETKLQSLIDSMKKGGNGHSKKRVDLG